MLSASYQFSIYNEDHSLISQSEKFPSKSFVENFLKIMTHYLGEQSAGNYDQLIDIGGTAFNPAQFYHNYAHACNFGGDLSKQNLFNIYGIGSDYNYAFPADQFGVVLGTGSTTVTAQDRSLATPITHGRSSGKFEYLTCAARNLTVNSGTGIGSFDMEGLVRNSSGGTITVNELGLSWTVPYVLGFSAYVRPCLVIRDVLGVGQGVNDGEYLKTIYTLQISV